MRIRRERADRSGRRRPAAAARPAAGARRQGHLAPRAAVRGHGRRPVARARASPVATTCSAPAARSRSSACEQQSRGRRSTVDGRGVDGLTEPDGVSTAATPARPSACWPACSPGDPFLSGADRRRLAACGGRWAGSSSRCAAMGAHVDGRDDGTLPPLIVRGGGLRRRRATSCAVASAQVKTALVLAGLQADGHHRDRPSPRPAATTPSGCSPRSARRSTGSTSATVRVTRRRARGRSSSTCPAIRRRPRSSWSRPPSRPAPTSCVEDVALNPARIAFVDVLRRMGADDRDRDDRRAARRAGRRRSRVRAAPLHGTTIEGAEIP